MKRILFIMMMCLPMMVMAQENAAPKKVAVYVTSDDENIDNTTKSIIGGELVNAIVKTRKYQAVERTADFLKQIREEQGYQRSGNVDDGQISALGKQFGVHYVCVANVLPFRENIYIQTRLIDVETATVLAFAKEISSSSDLVEIIAASEKVAFALIGAGGSSSSYSTSSRPSTGQGNVLELEANGVRFKMIKVEGGTFRMGSYSGDNDEQPVHSVTLSDYYIGETEVTQALWSAVMGTTVRQQKDKADVSSSKFPSIRGEGDNYPIYHVNWNECMEFVSRLSQITGRRFALPTEAQWEYAARGGNKSRAYTYSGSNNIFDVAWHKDNSSGNIHPVGTKMANELGIYDMSGNVLEWCSDWKGTYSSSLQTDPAGPSTGSGRVIRGGSWFDNASRCRSTIRYSTSPDRRDGHLGLRLVLLL